MWTPAKLDAAKVLWNLLKRRKTRKNLTKDVADLTKKDSILREMSAEVIAIKLRAWKKKCKTPKFIKKTCKLLTFIYLNVFYVTLILHFIN